RDHERLANRLAVANEEGIVVVGLPPEYFRHKQVTRHPCHRNEYLPVRHASPQDLVSHQPRSLSLILCRCHDALYLTQVPGRAASSRQPANTPTVNVRISHTPNSVTMAEKSIGPSDGNRLRTAPTKGSTILPMYRKRPTSRSSWIHGPSQRSRI